MSQSRSSDTVAVHGEPGGCKTKWDVHLTAIQLCILFLVLINCPEGAVPFYHSGRTLPLTAASSAFCACVPPEGGLVRLLRGHLVLLYCRG